MVAIRVNGDAIFKDVARISDIADSSTRVEYIGTSIGFPQLPGVIKTQSTVSVYSGYDYAIPGPSSRRNRQGSPIKCSIPIDLKNSLAH